MGDRRLRIKSNGLGRESEIVIIEADGTERQVPQLRRVTFAVACEGVATATLEAVDIDLDGEGVLIADTRRRMTEADVLRLLAGYQRATANLLQVATMYPEYAQGFARDQYAEHAEELRRWLTDMPALPDAAMTGPGGH